MKQLSLLGFASVLATLLAGCPIYDDYDDDCRGWRCSGGEDTGGSSATGILPGRCDVPSDCGLNETCGDDHRCHVGDCTLWGCSAGFECVVADNRTASCVAGGSSGQGGSGGGPDVVYCGNPDDCEPGETCAPDGTCTPGPCDQVLPDNTTLGCIGGYQCERGDDGTASCTPVNPAACGADADCADLGEGYLCVSGICTAPTDQCFDQTQCAANARCVEGKCTPACSADADCPDSYRCDEALGVCSEPARPCAVTNDCGGPDAVCVDGACVPRSPDSGCPEGEKWVENGCIPDQSGNFVCSADGEQGDCAPGSICLHRSCYISCDQPNANACDSQPPSLSECRTVTTSSGVHHVCGSSQNLGGECDPEAPCGEGKICIDGFCR